MTNEIMELIVSIANTVIDKVDPEREEYADIYLGYDEENNLCVQTGGDISYDETDIKEHLEWVFDELCHLEVKGE